MQRKCFSSTFDWFNTCSYSSSLCLSNNSIKFNLNYIDLHRIFLFSSIHFYFYSPSHFLSNESRRLCFLFFWNFYLKIFQSTNLITLNRLTFFDEFDSDWYEKTIEEKHRLVFNLLWQKTRFFRWDSRCNFNGILFYFL